MNDRSIVIILLELLGVLLRDGVTKADLQKTKEEIMSAISDFAAKVKAHQDKIDTAVSGLSGDVQALKDKITQLQNSAGQISPEDQALLDGIEAKASDVAGKLAALDDLTPPPAPPAPAPTA